MAKTEFQLIDRVLRQLNVKLPNGDCALRKDEIGNQYSVCRYMGKLFDAPAYTEVYQRAYLKRTNREFVVLWMTSPTNFDVYLNELVGGDSTTPFATITDASIYTELLQFIADNALDRLDTTTEVPYVIDEDPLRFNKVMSY